jgi:hypothetical protein
MATFKKGVVQVVDRYDLHMDLEVLKLEVPDANGHETCYLIRLSDARRLSRQADAEVADSARTYEFARMTILTGSVAQLGRLVPPDPTRSQDSLHDTWHRMVVEYRMDVDIVADADFNRTWATTSNSFNYPTE